MSLRSSPEDKAPCAIRANPHLDAYVCMVLLRMRKSLISYFAFWYQVEMNSTESITMFKCLLCTKHYGRGSGVCKDELVVDSRILSPDVKALFISPALDMHVGIHS